LGSLSGCNNLHKYSPKHIICLCRRYIKTSLSDQYHLKN
jgi:hypothetical protein